MEEFKLITTLHNEPSCILTQLQLLFHLDLFLALLLAVCVLITLGRWVFQAGEELLG